jgi:energy-coupling factor transporter ATP-binding protein EcfA2
MLKSKIGYNDNQSHLSEAKVLYSNEKIAFRNLSYRFEKPKRKYILHDLCGNFDPGTLTAIMGPSGCGKFVVVVVVVVVVSHIISLSHFFSSQKEKVPYWTYYLREEIMEKFRVVCN